MNKFICTVSCSKIFFMGFETLTANIDVLKNTIKEFGDWNSDKNQYQCKA